ncbi:hypothetical protein LCGC14_1489970 [marine sediment metagenome]|uniref:3-deoxy-manno-octulosonate cytidylyltransferase n=1 Tax=marine sediment metagenome TaxID=412755 RepID=A0A0F9J7N1_9ZZZZ
MTFKVVIPARFESARFPGKVLAKINEKPMIQHVYERALESGADEVIIAVDNKDVADQARKFGADVELTATGHPSGTDRIREVLENRGWDNDTIIVNVQGDSPLISPVSIKQVAEILNINPEADIATLMTRITKDDEFHNSNIVKVVTDARGYALYFSRAPIPAQEGYNVWAWRHLGIYGYRPDALRMITSSGPIPLEKFERLEQLRAMYMGLRIKVARAEVPHGFDVDVPDDVKVVERIMDIDDVASER